MSHKMFTEIDIEEELRTELRACLLGARARSGLSQSKLAMMAGVDQRTISEIETGYANPRLGTVGKIFAAMGLRIILKLSDGES